ncbi:hypothetical protein HYS93_03705 [Candidatus Daviesbacteria bacterium]|nr:hypothetical protein [Candidatus Daviesbacteria bacterium]
MSQNQKGIINPLLIIGLVIIFTLIALNNILTTTDYPGSGKLVLGEDSDSSSGGRGSSGSGSSGGSSGSGSSGSSGDSRSDDSSGSSSGSSGSSGSSDNASPRPQASTPRITNQIQPSKERTEIRFSEDERIKTRVEEGRSRIDVYSGGIKLRYEIRDNRVVIKAETEDGQEVEGEELFKIVDRVDKSGIKVATAGGEILVARNQTGALANFPLQIDLNTNQLIASTSAGPRVLTVLPDKAVENMIAANVISRLGPPQVRQAAESTEISSVSEVINLGERNNVPVYEIDGIKDHKLLGFIPVSTEVKVFVSAETGEVVAKQQSLLSRIIDFLSP